jgi:hypothetical protein
MAPATASAPAAPTEAKAYDRSAAVIVRFGSIAVTPVVRASIRAIVAVAPMPVHPVMPAMPPVTTARAEVGRLLRNVGRGLGLHRVIGSVCGRATEQRGCTDG